MLRRCFIFLDCAVAIYNYTAKKSKGKKNSQIAEHVSVQLQNDLNQYKSILLLAMNGCFNSVIVEYHSEKAYIETLKELKQIENKTKEKNERGHA